MRISGCSPTWIVVVCGIRILRLSTSPHILTNKHSSTGEVVDYKDWQEIPRTEALVGDKDVRRIKLDGSHTDRHRISEAFRVFGEKGQEVRAGDSAQFRPRLLPPKARRGSTSKANKELLEAVNASGAAFMTHATVEGKLLIRCAIGGTLTEQRHVDARWRLIQYKAACTLAAAYLK